MSKPLVLSKTSMDQFFSGCNFRFPLYKKYTRVKQSPAEKKGILVHKMLEDGIPSQPQPEYFDAYETAIKLDKMINNLGYKIIDREVKHIAQLTDEIQLFGYIDVVAELDGEPILVDYKTGGRPWKETKTIHGEIVVAKARGFQGPIYLTPPIVDEYFGGEWAGRMDYLYAPNQGVTKVYSYYSNEADHQNLIRAATMIAEAAERGWFPKNQGWLCGNCDFYNACYQTKNWRRYHKEKHGR